MNPNPKATTAEQKLAEEDQRASSMMRAYSGPLTQDLLLEPGKFGLGKVPTRLKPNATTQMVCGFCSTGCGLNVHLQDGEAVNLTPGTEYPVNRGMACPKGWEALSALRAHDRGTTPMLRGVMVSCSRSIGKLP